MTIEIDLIPDGGTEIPPEARDHTILASYLEAAAPLDESSTLAWRDIQRQIRPTKVTLRIQDARVEDFDLKTLESMTGAIKSNIAGLRKHPKGWQKAGE
jgi:hypothetical protein